MTVKNLIKNNFVLVIGLALPALLMIGFMIAASLPNVVSDPPEHDLIFAIPDHTSRNLPVALKLTVNQDGALQAQVTPVRQENYGYGTWKKLYLYEARAQKVRELPLPYPADMDQIAEVREFTVEATQGMKLDTASESPDGYALSHAGYSRSGLIGELFLGSRYDSAPRLRKGSHSVRLDAPDERAFYYGNIEFIGWVIGK